MEQIKRIKKGLEEGGPGSGSSNPESPPCGIGDGKTDEIEFQDYRLLLDRGKHKLFIETMDYHPGYLGISLEALETIVRRLKKK